MNGEMKVATRVPLLAVQNVADVVSDEIPGWFLCFTVNELGNNDDKHWELGNSDNRGCG